VSGLSSGVIALAAGHTHTCAVTNLGEVKCWGYNIYGFLGDGSATPPTSPYLASQTTPVLVQGLPNGIKAIAAGNHYTCALTGSGGVKCWGSNYSGMLGDGTTTDRSSPVDVSGLSSGVIAITANSESTCALESIRIVKILIII
jgi:alpha-tubulin suppressor-like RCC1 family protein